MSRKTKKFNAQYHDRIRKVRQVAVEAISELDRLRAAGPITQKALDAEVARIAHEKLHPSGCDLAVHRIGGGVTRLLIKARRMGSVQIRSRARYYLHNRSFQKKGGLTWSHHSIEKKFSGTKFHRIGKGKV